MRIGFSYLRGVLFPIRKSSNLEQFFINRFGRELYNTFFKSYTEKVWGVPCDKISAEWGPAHQGTFDPQGHLALREAARRQPGDIRQKGTETSLIEQFLYPKFGPGQMWEDVARHFERRRRDPPGLKADRHRDRRPGDQGH